MAEDFLHFMASQAERRIAQAQKDGEFDHLPGEGRPLELEDDSNIVSLQIGNQREYIQRITY